MNAAIYSQLKNSTISISKLAQMGMGKALERLKYLSETIILKNNEPVAALVSIDRFEELLNKEEDFFLLELAVSRMKSSGTPKSVESLMEEFGITQEDLDKIPEVELE